MSESRVMPDLYDEVLLYKRGKAFTQGRVFQVLDEYDIFMIHTSSGSYRIAVNERNWLNLSAKLRKEQRDIDIDEALVRVHTSGLEREASAVDLRLTELESKIARYEALEKAAWDVISELWQANQDDTISAGFARKIENTLGKALADCSADDGRISLEREDQDGEA